MLNASKKCQLSNCTRAASTLCFCCRRNVCTRHFTEHIEAIRAQIDLLANEVNLMLENIRDLNIEKVKTNSLSKIRQWQIDMHKLVDKVFEEKASEITTLCQINERKFQDFHEQHLSTVIIIQDDIRQLAEDGDATMEQIQSLKTQLKRLEKDFDEFQSDFLVVTATTSAEGLIHVSCGNIRAASSTPMQNQQRYRACLVDFAQTPNVAVFAGQQQADHRARRRAKRISEAPPNVRGDFGGAAAQQTPPSSFVSFRNVNATPQANPAIGSPVSPFSFGYAAVAPSGGFEFGASPASPKN